MKRIVTLVTFVMGEENNKTLVPPMHVLPLESSDEAADLVKRGLARWITQADADLQLANSTSSYSSLGIVKGEKIDETAGLVDAIVDAITDMDSSEFGKDKKPNVKAIEKILGQSITAADRDQAWEIYQQLVADGLGVDDSDSEAN